MKWPELFYTTLMGVMFALIQTGYFFHLSMWVTSAYPGFLTVTVCWLGGGVFGLYFSGKEKISIFESPMKNIYFLCASLTAYYLSYILCNLKPFILETLIAHGLLVIISGAQAGFFFGTGKAMFKKVSTLFFMENNGFILGWIVGFGGFVLWGTLFTLSAPLLTFTIILILLLRQNSLPEPDPESA